jgi:FKBP-type peptidyl-prolyl cis-trans isomerase FkpA
MRSYSLILILFIVACSANQNSDTKDITWTKDQSANFNNELTIEEDLSIKVFLASKPNWKMNKTGSGLRYFIYNDSQGLKAKSGMIAEVKYKINLLDGTLCYETKPGEVVQFEIDKSDVESGIQEGIKFMKVGEKAKFIIPSHLGHGLVGDFDKIPPLNSIIVDLELVNLKN